MIKEYLNKEKLHHAYLLKDTGTSVISEIKEFLKDELQFTAVGNPDFWCGEFDTFGINDGREITQLQSRTALQGDVKIFIIKANFFTTEAQNSLLKMFEEPTTGTHFFVITQNIETLLPTLRSRLFTIEVDIYSKKTFSSGVEIEEFLKITQPERIKLLKEIIDAKNKNTAISFLNELENTLYKKIKIETLKIVWLSVFEEIIKSKKYLNGRAPSVKMILEHIALITPIGN